MTLFSEMVVRMASVERLVGEDHSLIKIHEEQINGERGLSAAIEDLRDDVKGLRRTIWTVGAIIFAGMATFCISVLTVFGQ